LNKITDFTYLAVYDGHGCSGKEASQAANDYINAFLENKTSKINKIVSPKRVFELL